MKRILFVLLLLGCFAVLYGTIHEEFRNNRKNFYSKKTKLTSVPNQIFVCYKRQNNPTLQTAFKASIEAAYGIEEKRYFSFIDVYLYRTYWDKEETLEKLNRNPYVKFAEPDYFRHAVARIPNDLLFNNLWGLHNTGQIGGTVDADIDAPEAWDLTTGSSNVVVAVLDSGVDYDHEDLRANMWTNPGETAGNGVDDDGNGIVDDVYGLNAIKNSGDPMDNNDHGTHVSGSIGGVGNNGKGVTGVCWNVSIMALKFLNSGGSGSISNEIQCINYAIAKGAHIINASIGDYFSSQVEFNAIQRAKDAGILFIAAAGNDGTDNDSKPHYPSSYSLDNIIAVAASNRRDNLASFFNDEASNYGVNSVDVAAPGRQIQSCTPNNGYATWDGTSMAAPYVAGLAALIKAMDPTMTWQQIKNQILSNVDQKPAFSGKVLSGGRINAYSSLPAQQSSYTLQIQSQDGGTTNPSPGQYTHNPGANVVITASPDLHWLFSGWTGSIPSGHENDNPITITMNSNKSVTATFDAVTFDISGNVGEGTSLIREITKTGVNRAKITEVGSFLNKKNTLNSKVRQKSDFSRVKTVNANALSGVVMSGLTGNPVTNVSGNYSTEVVYGWSGTVTPTKQHYTFGPASRSYSNITSNTYDQDYTGTRIIYAPSNFSAKKELNRSLSQAEYINVLKWQMNPDNVNIMKYRIYRVEGGNQSLLVELNSTTFEYWHRGKEAETSYTYTLAAVNDEGREGQEVSRTVI